MMTKPRPSSSGSEFQGHATIHNMHLLIAILVVFLNLIIFIARLAYGREAAYALLMTVVLPVGMLALPGAWIYALYKTIRLEPPRSRAIMLLLFFIPGCWIPLLGPLAYLVLSLYFYSLQRVVGGGEGQGVSSIGKIPAD